MTVRNEQTPKGQSKLATAMLSDQRGFDRRRVCECGTKQIACMDQSDDARDAKSHLLESIFDSRMSNTADVLARDWRDERMHTHGAILLTCGRSMESVYGWARSIELALFSTTRGRGKHGR